MKFRKKKNVHVAVAAVAAVYVGKLTDLILFCVLKMDFNFAVGNRNKIYNAL
jgi:hypothetical protein